ncbi:MAG TPA: AMP-binding protein, partial [Frankiaceae bacterium]|nr:AMP-binding protein [Frankiaceae bacterium]
MTEPTTTPGPRPGYRDRPWLASYPPGVPADPQIPTVPLTRLLDDAAAAYPARVALAFLGATLTYAQLVEQVDRFAAALAGLGVRPGDRVALVLPNCPQNVISFYATLRLGAIAVEHNPLYTEAEMNHQLADCGARVVVCLDRTYAVVAAARHGTAVEEVVVTSVADYMPVKARLALALPRALPLPALRRRRAAVVAPVPKGAAVRRFRALLHDAPGPAGQAEVDPAHDPAVLQYTGGTTGRAKGAILTHRNLVANAHQCRLWFPQARMGREVTLAVLPLFHAYGLTLCMTTTILLAGTVVLLPRFDLDLLFRAVDQWRPTLFPGAPPMYQAILDAPALRDHDLSSISACISGAMRLPVEVQERFEAVTGGRLVEGYGLTEASPVALANPLVGTRKTGTIGVPIPATRARLVDPEDASREVEPGGRGELAIAGPQVFGGYWAADGSSPEA